MNPLLFLNGYKMLMGLILFGVGSAMEAMDVPGGEPVKSLGSILAGIGASHKLMKGA